MDASITQHITPGKFVQVIKKESEYSGQFGRVVDVDGDGVHVYFADKGYGLEAVVAFLPSQVCLVN